MPYRADIVVWRRRFASWCGAIVVGYARRMENGMHDTDLESVDRPSSPRRGTGNTEWMSDAFARVRLSHMTARDMGQIQRTVGNNTAMQLIQRETTQAESRTSPVTEPNSKKNESAKFSIIKEFENQPAIPLGPIEYEGLEVEGELEWQPAEQNRPEEDHTPKTGSTEVKVASIGGVSDGTLGSGVEAKVEHAFGTRLLGATPKVAGGGKMTNQGIEIGTEFELEGEHKSTVIHGELMEWEPGRSPKFGVLKYEDNVNVITPAINIPGLGQGTIKFTGKLTGVFQPNYKEIEKWVSEKFGKEVLVDSAFDLGIIAVGVATIGATI